jgi:hypothetical protein
MVKCWRNRGWHSNNFTRVDPKFWINSVIRQGTSYLEARVTRLGELSPSGRHFAFGTFVKITEVAQNVGQLFPKCRLCINFDKKRVGLQFGQFCHKLTWSPYSKLHLSSRWRQCIASFVYMYKWCWHDAFHINRSNIKARFRVGTNVHSTKPKSTFLTLILHRFCSCLMYLV